MRIKHPSFTALWFAWAKAGLIEREAGPGAGPSCEQVKFSPEDDVLTISGEKRRGRWCPPRSFRTVGRRNLDGRQRARRPACRHLSMVSADERRPGTRPIELRVREIGQLFHTLDPLPYRERDLDRDVEDYVTAWAGELPQRAPIDILIRLPARERAREAAGHVSAAFRNYFAYRSQVAGWELRALLRQGRTALAIGLAVLAVCIVAGQIAGRWPAAGYVGRYFQEGLIIVGWVANWRPIEILLYDWWPLAERRRLYRRLAEARVSLLSDNPPEAPPGR
ncbi:hypothetical protein [Phenylobacterium sp. J367]|uniref:hypothetical protein n=1 Tax=Phenylobacterium sp. J367 TaxID=2898435 RepID=UPI002151F137|nr:hypothetical protein [Phenylobacterium sp. J367]MCR5879281.1 hypothetical protein [Phenylobacterium sp. J367]